MKANKAASKPVLIDEKKWCDIGCQRRMEYTSILELHGKKVANSFAAYAAVSDNVRLAVDVGIVAGGGGIGKWGAAESSATVAKGAGRVDVYAATRAGNAPAWSTVRARFWKSEARNGDFGDWDASDTARMSRGLAPQRYNPDKGGIESMELSHEPTPAREGGTEFVPRWPQEHAAVDPYRRPGY